MANRDNTNVTDYQLVKLTVDAEPIPFTKATITRTITWTGLPRSRWRSTHWQGEIVSPTYKFGRAAAANIYRLAAETSEGYRLAGYFKVVRTESECVDIAGTSALMRTD